MNGKLIGAAALLLCFAALAIPSGAIPAMSDAAAEATVPPTAAPADPPRTSPSPSPTRAPAMTLAPELIYEPEAAAADGPVTVTNDGTQIIATTITDEDMLDNDTYYDVDAAALLQEGIALSLPREGYQILIVHTHATEAYTQEADDPYEATDAYRTTDAGHSVVRVGEELAAALEAYGLNVLHCTTVFDYPSYNGSYVRSGAAIEEYLQAYPGIRIVIDLHRDAIGDGDTMYKTMANIDGVYAAQMLFVMGSDVNLEHPYWRENLKLALTLQQAANERYGTLMRPTNLCAYRYNQQLTAGSLLLEVGTAGNTLSEAISAVRLFAETAGPVLASYIEP